MFTENGLHAEVWGHGEPVVMVHGSFSWGEEAFEKQRELMERYKLFIVDRRGFGESPPVKRCDFEVDARDISEILGEGSHLVGHSYGGVVSLIAAALTPEAVRSLTVIEPPAFGLARGNSAVEQLITNVTRHYLSSRDTTPEEFYAGFLRAWGLTPPRFFKPSEKEVGAIRTSMRERPPWEALIPLEKLASASFPKLIVSGGWSTAPTKAREIGGMAFRAVCDVLEHRLGAERAVFEEAAHNPQLLGKPFNDRLESFLKSASNP